MARPKKDARERLDAKVSFRLPTHVNQAWRQAAEAADLSLADWLRSQVRVDGVAPVITNKPTPKRGIARSRPFVAADPALLREIAKIGNNLNQLSRAVNRHGAAGYELQILEQLIGIERELLSLLPPEPEEAEDDAH